MDGWGQAALDDTAPPSFLGRISETFKMFEFIEVIYIKIPKGGLSFSLGHSGVKALKKSRKTWRRAMQVCPIVHLPSLLRPTRFH